MARNVTLDCLRAAFYAATDSAQREHITRAIAREKVAAKRRSKEQTRARLARLKAARADMLRRALP